MTADKPDLPALPEYDYAYTYMQNAHVVSLKDAIAYAEACRADERRQLIAEILPIVAECDVVKALRAIRALIDREEPTT